MMPDLFGNPTQEAPVTFDPNPNEVTEGDVVEIPYMETSSRQYTGFARKVVSGAAWVDSDVKRVTGWYSLVALRPLNKQNNHA